MPQLGRSMHDRLSVRPAPESIFVRMLTLVLMFVVLVAGVLLIVEPESYVLTLPITVIAFLLFLFAFLSVIRDPPAWFYAALIVLAFAMMDLNLRPGTPAGGGLDAQSVVKGLIWLFVMFFGIVHGRALLIHTPLTFLLLTYALIGIASVAYAPSFSLAAGGGISLLAVATYAGVIGKMKNADLNQLWRYLYWSIVLIAILSLLAYFALPDWSRDMRAGGLGRLRGITGSANSLGPIAALGVILSTYRLATANTRQMRITGLCLSGILLLTLAATQSRGAILGLIAAYLLHSVIIYPLAFVILAVIAVLLIWLVFQPSYLQWLVNILTQEITRSGESKELLSMTGRTDIWSAIIPKWLESPWFGFGLGGPRTAIPDAYRDIWGNTQESAHNWVLESLLSVGLFGTMALFIFILLLTLKAWRLHKRFARLNVSDSAALATCILRCVFFLFISGMVEKGFAGMPSPGTALLAVLAGSVIALERQALSGAHV